MNPNEKLTAEERYLISEKAIKEKYKCVMNGDRQVFYPDPCQTNDCAQCGKSKEQHNKEQNLIFCYPMTAPHPYQLYREIAEHFATQETREKDKEIEKLTAIAQHNLEQHDRLQSKVEGLEKEKK